MVSFAWSKAAIQYVLAASSSVMSQVSAIYEFGSCNKEKMAIDLHHQLRQFQQELAGFPGGRGCQFLLGLLNTKCLARTRPMFDAAGIVQNRSILLVIPRGPAVQPGQNGSFLLRRGSIATNECRAGRFSFLEIRSQGFAGLCFFAGQVHHIIHNLERNPQMGSVGRQILTSRFFGIRRFGAEITTAGNQAAVLREIMSR